MSVYLSDLIDRTEGAGNYDTLYGHSQREGGRFAGIRPTEMTLEEMMAFQSPSGEYGQWVKGRPEVGRVATPAGRYQIVGTTLRNAVEDMGLDPSRPFDKTTQDLLAGHLAGGRLSNAGSMADKRRQLRAEWEGFKHVSDGELDAAIRTYEETGRFGNPEAGVGDDTLMGGSGNDRLSASPSAGIGEQDPWSKKREAEKAEEEDYHFSGLGRKLGLEDARNSLLEKMGIGDETAAGLGRVMAGLGGLL